MKRCIGFDGTFWLSACLTLTVGTVGGYVANIVKLTGMSFDPVTPLLVLRGAGLIFPPLGAVMGYL